MLHAALPALPATCTNQERYSFFIRELKTPTIVQLLYKNDDYEVKLKLKEVKLLTLNLRLVSRMVIMHVYCSLYLSMTAIHFLMVPNKYAMQNTVP